MKKIFTAVFALIAVVGVTFGSMGIQAHASTINTDEFVNVSYNDDGSVEFMLDHTNYDSSQMATFMVSPDAQVQIDRNWNVTDYDSYRMTGLASDTDYSVEVDVYDPATDTTFDNVVDIHTNPTITGEQSIGSNNYNLQYQSPLSNAFHTWVIDTPSSHSLGTYTADGNMAPIIRTTPIVTTRDDYFRFYLSTTYLSEYVNNYLHGSTIKVAIYSANGGGTKDDYIGSASINIDDLTTPTGGYKAVGIEVPNAYAYKDGDNVAAEFYCVITSYVNFQGSLNIGWQQANN